MNNIKLFSLLLAICVFFFRSPVFATELEEADPATSVQEQQADQTEQPADNPSDVTSAYSPCVHIQVAYSSDIAPQQNDNFCIYYRNAGSAESASITFDASTLSGNIGKLDLPAGDYEITDIEYQGSNNIIYKQGYAINKTFSVGETPEAYSEFILAIGYETGSGLIEQNDGDYIAIQNGYSVNRLEAAEAVSVEGEEDTSTELTDNQTNVSTENTAEETNEQNKKLDTSNVYQGSVLGRLIPLVICAIIGVSIMIYWRKQGKL